MFHCYPLKLAFVYNSKALDPIFKIFDIWLVLQCLVKQYSVESTEVHNGTVNLKSVATPAFLEEDRRMSWVEVGTLDGSWILAGAQIGSWGSTEAKSNGLSIYVESSRTHALKTGALVERTALWR